MFLLSRKELNISMLMSEIVSNFYLDLVLVLGFPRVEGKVFPWCGIFSFAMEGKVLIVEVGHFKSLWYSRF